jgi:Flp pilus assembly protein TadD
VTARPPRKPSLAAARFSAAPLVAALWAAPASSQQTAPPPIALPSPPPAASPSASSANSPAVSAAAAACQAAANDPSIAAVQAELAGKPDDLDRELQLAAAWSAAGCFSNALQELQLASNAHPDNHQVETQLRAARSLVAAAHFFDHLDRTSAAARLRQATDRCTSEHELDACDDALRLKPDDPTLLIAQGDALVRAKRPADAVERYRLAAVLAPEDSEVAAKLAAAEGQLQLAAATAPTTAAAHAAAPAPAEGPEPLRAATGAGAPGTLRRYSNSAPEAQSH